MMSVAFVLRMFPNVFVQIRALGVCLVATNKLFVAPKIPIPYFVLHPVKDSLFAVTAVLPRVAVCVKKFSVKSCVERSVPEVTPVKGNATLVHPVMSAQC